MGKIYKNSAEVLIWIGDQTFYTGDAIAIFRRFAELLHTFKLKHGRSELDLHPYLEEQDLDSSTKEWVDNVQQPASWLGVIDLFWPRTYFNRLWIIQEVILAPKATVICGSYRIDWKTYCQAVMCIDILHRNKHILNLDMRAIDDIANIVTLGELSFHGSGLNMATILGCFPNAKVTDPRDHIYGYLGILDEQSLEHEIRVDYSSTVEDVFRTATANIFTQDQDLTLFKWQCVEPFSRPRATIPSWVRDWGHSEPRFDSEGVPEIEEHLGSEQIITVNGDFLTAKGLIIDSIEKVSDNFCDGNVGQIVNLIFSGHLSRFSEMTLDNIIMEARKTFQCFNKDSDLHLLPLREEDFFALLAASLLGDVRLNRTVLGEHPLSLALVYPSLKKRFPDEFEAHENVSSLTRKSVLWKWLHSQHISTVDFFDTRTALHFRLFRKEPPLGLNMFRSTRGFEGLGPAGRNLCERDMPVVQAGDHIALFPSLDVLMIVRERRALHDGAYTLIGTTHVGNLTEISWYNGVDPKLVPIRLR